MKKFIIPAIIAKNQEELDKRLKKVQNLFEITEIRLQAAPLGIKKIVADYKYGKIEFCEKPNIDPDKLIKLIQSKASKYKLVGSNSLRFVINDEDHMVKIQKVREVIAELS